MMSQSPYRIYLLPIGLGVLGLTLLIRVFILEASVLLPEAVDVLALVMLLSTGMVFAVHTLVRLSMAYLRSRSVLRVRRETLAEHQRFLRRLDHEFKNPLTALRAGLKTLSLTELNQQQQQLVNTLETETVRLSRLVTDLRKLAELVTQPLELQPINIEAFVGNILHLEQERFEANQRILTSRILAVKTDWLLDEDLLALAIHNLLDNAIKFTQPNDQVELIVSAHQELFIQVVDTGLGIPSNALPHIWEELYRANHVEKIPGSGIGLALVKAIVERHHGTIDIESDIGQGTTVSLHLPMIPQN
jgi:two-component system OmpR family sensor kinase